MLPVRRRRRRRQGQRDHRRAARCWRPRRPPSGSSRAVGGGPFPDPHPPRDARVRRRQGPGARALGARHGPPVGPRPGAARLSRRRGRGARARYTTAALLDPRPCRSRLWPRSRRGACWDRSAAVPEQPRGPTSGSISSATSRTPPSARMCCRRSPRPARASRCSTRAPKRCSAARWAARWRWSSRAGEVYPLDFDSPDHAPGTYTIEVAGQDARHLSASSPSRRRPRPLLGAPLANALNFYENERDGPEYIPSALRSAAAHRTTSTR